MCLQVHKKMITIPPVHQNDLAIVVVGFNRLRGLQRLLGSLEKATYNDNSVPLVISIDASGNQDVYDFVRSYQWKYGPKYVNIESERLGLKNHIFQCGRLSEFFKGVIILEDDLFVSSDFYRYSLATLEKYGNDHNISGIALYSEGLNGYVNIPFIPLSNGSDVYAFQSVCSWGQIWNKRMWSDFESWYVKWDKDFTKIEMVEFIKSWSRAWSKYYYAYLIANNKYFICPYVSLSTNFNDAGGEHGGGSNSIVQVNLLHGKRFYNLYDYDNLVKYDVYQQNEILYDLLPVPRSETTLDLYGCHFDEGTTKRYLLSAMILPYKVIKSYSLSLRPIELNVQLNLDGTGIFLYDTSKKVNNRKPKMSVAFIDYYLCGFNFRYLVRYVFRYIKRKFIKW